MPEVSIAKYQSAQDRIVDAALKDLERLYKALDLSDGVAAREALSKIITDLVQVYGSASASEAVSLFMLLRAEAGIASAFAPRLATAATPEAIDGSVRWAVATLFGDAYNEAVTLSKLKDVTTRHLLQQGRDSIALNVASPQSGSGAFARILGPGENCKFCLMLSSRGYAYRSAESAKAGWHDGCRCSAVPGFKGVEVAGYDPDALLEEYKKLSEQE